MESRMAIAGLKGMDVFELIDLRDRVDARISEVRRDLEKSLHSSSTATPNVADLRAAMAAATP
jgi:hypothetical protein